MGYDFHALSTTQQSHTTHENGHDMTSAQSDLFGNAGGGGSYPKMDELEGKLLLITPIEVEQVPKPESFGGKPGETQDRLRADVVVFEDDGSYEEHSEMFFSQAALVGAGKRHLKPNAKRFVLGRIGKVPSKIGKAQAGKYDSREKIEAGLEEWVASKGKKEKPNFAWGLDDYTPADAEMAMVYVHANSPMGNASDE